MTTILGREPARKRLADLLKTDIDAALSIDALVLPAEPKETEAQSPIITVHSAGSRLAFPGYAMEYHGYWVSWYSIRDDPEASEDFFDDLSRVIFQSLLDHHVEPGYWQDLIFGQEDSEATYITMEGGTQFRTERLKVTVESICDN